MKKLPYMLALPVLLWIAPINGGQWNYGGQLGVINFDNDTARQQGIDNSAVILSGYAEFQSDALVAISMGMEYLDYDDHEEFSQRVEWDGVFGSSGDTHVESSDAYGFFAYADAGPRWKFGTNKNSYVTTAIGLNTAITSERTILNCADCYAEDIDIDGGGYVKLAIGTKLGAVNVGLLYREFLNDSSGMDNTMYLTIGTGFN